MSTGWICPNCNYSWSPSVTGCYNCNRPEQDKTRTTTGISLVDGTTTYFWCNHEFDPTVPLQKCKHCGFINLTINGNTQT